MQNPAAAWPPLPVWSNIEQIQKLLHFPKSICLEPGYLWLIGWREIFMFQSG